ncbi:hypothetical protein N7522_004622 [Penicillium canescens]|uniref:uncharacterized protein n=1 Tax=Penicillium canescens TaxID=5083 RepID=UPI0026DF5943|nr:uncharacterized protein N7446_004506 [Penicillium canescens]KAJ6009606.1 hypothetical protein N7522_004622 [Penicillium canescens]KAJ6067469.1 hypothetical protein N7446_004506 [Penicillium canescens]
MGWSLEAIIALMTLLITGPPSLVLLWIHFQERRGSTPTDREQSVSLLWISESEYTGYNERLIEDGLVDYRIPAS